MAERQTFPYANKQKVPFVCFGCRLAIKRAIPFYLEEFDDVPRPDQRPYSFLNCPNCQQPMAFLGRYFKVPPRSAIKQWRKSELLWQKGWTADGYSLSPRTLSEAKNYEADLKAQHKKLRLNRIRAQNEEKWRSVRIKRHQLQRHAG